MNFPDLHLNWERTKTIAAATSNTWGLFVLVSCENRNRLKFKSKTLFLDHYLFERIDPWLFIMKCIITNGDSTFCSFFLYHLMYFEK